MLYNNNSINAVLEMERQRTGNYGEDFENAYMDSVCENCSDTNSQLFDFNSHVFCQECILEYFRDKFADIPEIMPDTEASQLLSDIVSDFSDNELLCYIENRYRKIN